ncbi:MAG: inorganic diphosphatase [Candidatus Micrarchaeaceae archaeon]
MYNKRMKQQIFSSSVYALIEMESGGVLKYKYDQKEMRLKPERIFARALHKEICYGFIINTLGFDEYPLNIFIISKNKYRVGDLVLAKPIGMLEMEDQDGADDKIVSIDVMDKRSEKISDISELPEGYAREIYNEISYSKRNAAMRWGRLMKFSGAEKAKEEIDNAFDNFLIEKENEKEALTTSPFCFL